jgi:prevent-host-death family protein
MSIFEEKTMARVSSSEFIKNYGALSRRALREPVTITNHGHDSLVLVAADQFERLQAQDTRRAYYAHELPEDLAEALEGARPPAWTQKYNHEYDPEVK